MKILFVLFILSFTAIASEKKPDEKEIDIDALLKRVREIHEAQRPSMKKVKSILHGKEKEEEKTKTEGL